MRILITGATGFVGRPLVARLLEQGHAVRAWVRAPARAAKQLGPEVDLIDATGGLAVMQTAVADVDAILNLAGATA